LEIFDVSAEEVRKNTFQIIGNLHLYTLFLFSKEKNYSPSAMGAPYAPVIHDIESSLLYGLPALQRRDSDDHRLYGIRILKLSEMAFGIFVAFPQNTRIVVDMPLLRRPFAQ